MIGKLVAVRIDDLGATLRVTGLVAQAKNRKAAWTFEVLKEAEHAISEKVEEMEADRKARKAS